MKCVILGGENGLVDVVNSFLSIVLQCMLGFVIQGMWKPKCESERKFLLGTRAAARYTWCSGPFTKLSHEFKQNVDFAMTFIVTWAYLTKLFSLAV